MPRSAQRIGPLAMPLAMLVCALPMLLTPPQRAIAEEPLDDAANESWDEEWDHGGATALRWTGFIEGGYGSRWKDAPAPLGPTTLRELTLRLETAWSAPWATLDFKGEARYDDVAGGAQGKLRSLNLALSPGEHVELKLGRQVLTWGTGDLLFLNDLFPKDFVSFFAGRDDEYLKAPSTAIRITAYTDALNADLVWTPAFTPDEYLSGRRFAFFSPNAGAVVAPDPPLAADTPRRGELALRLFRTLRGTEYALYGYYGFTPQPNALSSDQTPRFAALAAAGASLRRPALGGLVSMEAAYHFAREDRAGDDPLVPNDQLRLLLGYEREVLTHLTAGLQYYLEWTRDHDALIAASPFPAFEPEEFRQVLTVRLTHRALRERLVSSLFAFYSPGDHDAYLRPVLAYRHNDRWSLAAGANWFTGRHPQTFFGQLERNSNAWARLRFNF